MIYHFSGSLALLFLVVVIALPVKLAAHFASAQRTGFLWCASAVAVGFASGWIASRVAGGLIGGPLAGFIGFVLGIRFMLGTSVAAALGLSVIACGLSLVGLSLMGQMSAMLS